MRPYTARLPNTRLARLREDAELLRQAQLTVERIRLRVGIAAARHGLDRPRPLHPSPKR